MPGPRVEAARVMSSRKKLAPIKASRDGDPGGSWAVSFWSQKRPWRNTSDTKICIKYVHIAMKTLDWIFWEYWGMNALPAYRGAFDVLLPQIPRCLMVAERVLAHGMNQILWHGCYTEQQTVDIGTFSPLLVAPAFRWASWNHGYFRVVHPHGFKVLVIRDVNDVPPWFIVERDLGTTWKHYNYWFLDQILSMLRSEWIFIARSLDVKCLWHPSGWFVSPDSIMRMRSLFNTWLFGLGLRTWKNKKQ